MRKKQQKQLRTNQTHIDRAALFGPHVGNGTDGLVGALSREQLCFPFY